MDTRALSSVSARDGRPEDRPDDGASVRLSFIAWASATFAAAVLVGTIALATAARGDDCALALHPGRLASNLATVAANINDLTKGRAVDLNKLDGDVDFLDRVVDCLDRQRAMPTPRTNPTGANR